MIGQTISHYEILDKLGEGGMGVVYKAQDTKLDRFVAMKFLPHHLSGNEAEKARFLQEAKAASALNHPNVCTIYDIKEENNQQFIVMEFVDGMTLKNKIPVQKVQDALTYALQIGEALHEAHGKGIVHRDIKCENIMVNSKNQIKVMDFGLAKLKGSLKLTKTSSTIGTLAYMAPEQIQGGEVDARSDIFSFGVVVFEMLTGRLPFRGDHEAAMMYSIINEEPESVQQARKDVPAEIDRIIRRSLEKDPEDRYQHIDDMVSELRRVQKQSSKVSRTTLRELPSPQVAETSSETRQIVHAEISSTTAGQPKKQTRLFVIAGIVIVVFAAIIIGTFTFFGRHQSVDSIAVLPFTNVGADPNTEYLSDGVTESLINSLSQLSDLSVMSRSSVFHYKGNDFDPQKAGTELGVKAVLVGRVTQRGDNLQISTELVNVANNTHIWGQQYNKKLSDILTIQDEISKEISQQLSLKLVGEDEKKLAKHSTENTEAYQLYLKGRFYWNKRKADELQKAVDYFNQALEKDPHFALAYAGLASAYAILPEYSGLPAKDIDPKAETAASKALEFDASLAEPHAVLGLIKFSHQWNWDGAERELKRAIELNPNYPTAYHWYSISLRLQGKLEESLTEIKRAQQLDPLSLVINLNVAEVLLYMQKDDLAIEQLKKTLELDPNFPGAHTALGSAYAEQGNYTDAIRELQTVRQVVGPNDPTALGILGFVYAKAGRKNDANEMLKKMFEFTKRGYALAVPVATVYAGLGDNDRVFEWLEKGYHEQNVGIGYLKISPVWNDVHSDPRYAAFLKRLGLEK